MGHIQGKSEFGNRVSGFGFWAGVRARCAGYATPRSQATSRSVSDRNQPGRLFTNSAPSKRAKRRIPPQSRNLRIKPASSVAYASGSLPSPSGEGLSWIAFACVHGYRTLVFRKFLLFKQLRFWAPVQFCRVLSRFVPFCPRLSQIVPDCPVLACPTGRSGTAGVLSGRYARRV